MRAVPSPEPDASFFFPVSAFFILYESIILIDSNISSALTTNLENESPPGFSYGYEVPVIQ